MNYNNTQIISYGTLAGFTAKAGYTFKGWYTAASGGTAVTASTTVGSASAHTIYAQCTANTYTVTYDANHGNYGTRTEVTTSFKGTTQTLAAGTSVPVVTSSSLALSTNTNYILQFLHWSDGANQHDVDIFPDDLPQYNPTVSTTATWRTWMFSSASSNMGSATIRFFNDINIPNPYNIYINNIRLYKCAGCTTSSTATVTYDSTYGTMPTPTREGHTFAGWATSGGTAVTSISTVSTASNHTLYAQWSANSIGYTVNYVSTTGVSLGSETVSKTYGTTATITPPAKTGYTTKSSAISVTWDTTTAKTFTFTYEPITYTVTVNCNGGSGVSSTTYTIETATFTLGTPTRSYYNFTGWTGSSSGTTITIAKGSTGNKTYTANWQNIIYTITPGTYISYTGNSYSSWRVLFNNSGQLDIVSTGSVGTYTLAGNSGFLNGVADLNSYAQNWLTGYGTSARSIGCTSQSTANLSSMCWNCSGSPYSDSYHTVDVNQMKNYGLVQTDTEVWLASRWISGESMGTGAGLKTLYTDGSIGDHRLQGYYIAGQNNRAEHTYGFRPVISLKSGLLITGGSGTSSSPYVVSG